MQYPVQGIYHLNTGDRTAIILKFICPFCKRDVYFTGAFSDLAAIVHFALMTFCPECDNDFSWMKGGGILPEDRTAGFWVEAAKKSKRYYAHKDAVACFNEQKNMPITKRQSEKKMKKRKKHDSNHGLEDYYAS